MAGRKSKYYINNKEMLAELEKCHEQGEMTERFAEMIMLIADKFAERQEYLEFSPHIEDMKSVAYLTIVKAWRSFDPEKSNNPFAYFTQAIKHAFWQYVSQEKKQRIVRDELLLDNGELPSDRYMEAYEEEQQTKKNGDEESDGEEA